MITINKFLHEDKTPKALRGLFFMPFGGSTYHLYKVIHSEKTIGVDIDKFERGDINILLICGIIGSGKTELGRKLAKLYDCSYINLDTLWWNVVQESNIENYENLTVDQIHSINQKIVQAAIAKAGGNRTIIEGVQLFLAPKQFVENTLAKYAVIFIGSSLIGAALNIMKRDIISSVPMLRVIKNMFIKNPRWVSILSHHRAIRASVGDSNVVPMDERFIKRTIVDPILGG